MDNSCTTFISDDIKIHDFDFGDIDRYVFTSRLTIDELQAKDYDFDQSQDFSNWAEDHLTYEELYQVPMMNAVYYFPFFVSFSNEDRAKCVGSTTLFYDQELEAWAVGMTGGGMDLAPYLLATFIALGRGVPRNIANAIRPHYSASISSKEHQHNCTILAEAFIIEGERNRLRYHDLIRVD